MKTFYLYAEHWPNNRSYIGYSVDPKRRHRQHLGELSNGSRSIRKEIADQGGIQPEMSILAIFDPSIKHTCGSYEQVITEVAKKAGWDLIYDGPHWPPPLEARIRGGHKGGRISGNMHTPAQQKARGENGRKSLAKLSKEEQLIRSSNGGRKSMTSERAAIYGRKYGALNGIKSSAKLSPRQVREIRTRLKGGESGTNIAKEFLVHQVTISNINLGRTYKWVDDKEEGNEGANYVRGNRVGEVC